MNVLVVWEWEGDAHEYSVSRDLNCQNRTEVRDIIARIGFLMIWSLSIHLYICYFLLFDVPKLKSVEASNSTCNLSTARSRAEKENAARDWIVTL